MTKKKSNAHAGIDAVVDSSLSKLIASRPNMEPSPTKRNSSTVGNSMIPPVSDHKPAAAGATLYPVAADFDDDSGEFDFKRIAASSVAPFPTDDKKMSSIPPATMNSSYNRGDYGYSSSSKLPMVPAAPGADDFDDDHGMPQKMSAKKPPPAPTPGAYPSDYPRKLTPEEKVQEKIRQEDEMRKKGVVPGALRQDSSFLARPDRMEERIAQKMNEFAPSSSAPSKPGVQRVDGPNAGPRAEVQVVQQPSLPNVQIAQPQEQVDQARKSHKHEDNNKNLLMLGLMGVALVVVVVVVVVLVVALGGKSAAAPSVATPPPPPTAETSPSPNADYVMGMLPEATQAAVNTDGSPQAKAFAWMTGDTALMERNYSKETILQRFALATFYFSTTGPAWEKDDNWLNYTAHECTWFSAVDEGELPCDQKVDTPNTYVAMKQLYLHDNGLSGSIPPEISVLTKLHTWDLSGNTLNGMIPTEVGLMTGLLKIDFSQNALTGGLPTTLGQLTNLKELYLEQNQLTGNVPGSLNNTKIQYMRLGSNPAMAGRIPDEACPEKSLFIDCSDIFCGCTCVC